MIQNWDDEKAFAKSIVDWKFMNFMQDCLMKYEDNGIETFVECSMAMEDDKVSNKWIVYTTNRTYMYLTDGDGYLPEWRGENMSFKEYYDSEAIFYGLGVIYLGNVYKMKEIEKKRIKKICDDVVDRIKKRYNIEIMSQKPAIADDSNYYMTTIIKLSEHL